MILTLVQITLVNKVDGSGEIYLCCASGDAVYPGVGESSKGVKVVVYRLFSDLRYNTVSLCI